MKKRIMTLLMVILLQGMLLSPTYADYLFDTGEGNMVSYYLRSTRPLVAAQFSNAVGWEIGSIEGYFSVGAGQTQLKAMIWSNLGGNFPPNGVFESVPFAVGPNYGWNGVYGLNWTLPAGTYWVGFTYVSGPDDNTSANIYAGALKFPDNSLRDAQYALVGTPPSGQWYILDYDHCIRIGDTSAVPLPPSVLLLGSGLVGLLALGGRRRRRRD